MRRPLNRPKGAGSAVLWDLLTFEHLMTNQVIHIIYWAGLALIALGAFGTIGAAVGLAIRDPFPFGLLLAVPVVVGGLLVMGALVLLWRSFCELYVAIFRISENLDVLREVVDAERKRTPCPRRSPAPSFRRTGVICATSRRRLVPRAPRESNSVAEPDRLSVGELCS